MHQKMHRIINEGGLGVHALDDEITQVEGGLPVVQLQTQRLTRSRSSSSRQQKQLGQQQEQEQQQQQ